MSCAALSEQHAVSFVWKQSNCDGIKPWFTLTVCIQWLIPTEHQIILTKSTLQADAMVIVINVRYFSLSEVVRNVYKCWITNSLKNEHSIGIAIGKRREHKIFMLNPTAAIITTNNKYNFSQACYNDKQHILPVVRLKEKLTKQQSLITGISSSMQYHAGRTRRYENNVSNWRMVLNRLAAKRRYEIFRRMLSVLMMTGGCGGNNSE